jgi:YHS domain-containing protein
MAMAPELIVVDSRDAPAASCVVCGNDISAGEGVTAHYHGRTLRFKCPGCYTRFEADPERYLAGQRQSCCDGKHDHSPASEWRCD